ncbi:MAG: hypothetical protein ACLFUJ_03270 [Phycisphaerae bacterium]
MCPFLEQSNPLCAAHLTMSNIASAFAHCADKYEHCPVYAQMLLRQPEQVLAAARRALPVRAAS